MNKKDRAPGLNSVGRNREHIILVSIVFLIILGVSILPKIPQPINYFDYADKRVVLGIPNLINGVSAFGFLIVGFIGLFALFLDKEAKRQFIVASEKWIFTLFFASIIGRGAGKVFYHLFSSSLSLTFLRFFMSVIIACLYVIFISAKISPRTGIRVFLPLLVVALGCALSWKISEMAGQSDIRFYSSLKLSIYLFLPLILWLYRGNYDGTHYLAQCVIWLGISSICEAFDDDIFFLTKNYLSGHTLSHFSGAYGYFFVVRYLMHRKMFIFPNPFDHSKRSLLRRRAMEELF